MGDTDVQMVTVPVRGACCIFDHDMKVYGLEMVAVPVRGAGCIHGMEVQRKDPFVAVPVRGAGCIYAVYAFRTTLMGLLSP